MKIKNNEGSIRCKDFQLHTFRTKRTYFNALYEINSRKTKVAYKLCFLTT